DGEDGVTPQSFAVTIAGTGSGPEISSVTFPDDVFDIVLGTSGPDNNLTGGDGRDWIVGLAGDDALFGDVGDDQLFGGAGDDVLTGGEGVDQLTGGAGSDEFVFLADVDGTLEVDQILDYKSV